MMLINKQLKALYKMAGRFVPVLLVSMLSFALITGCSDSNGDNPVNNNNNSPSKVQGKVTDNSGFQKASGTTSTIQGATVILARVKANGSLETVSNASVQTDVNGQFTVETDVDGESDLVVVATKGSSEWRAVISSKVQNGITVYAPPLNDETTVEAKVYANVKASGNSNTTYADVASSINADIAAQVKSNTSAMAQLASSIEAEADARAQAFMSSSVGGTQAEWNAIASARANAQATLERDLFVASSQSNIDAAFDAYNNANINAYVNAGLDASAYGKIYEAASRVYLNSTTSISSSVKFAVEKRIAKLKARILNFIIQAKFTAMGAAQAQMNNVISAAVTLNSSIDAATTSSDIVTAFDNYHTAVVNELKVTLGVSSSTITTIETNIAGFQATLKSSVNATVSTNAVISAYMKFYSDVKSTVETNLTTATQTQVNATAQILILLNAQF